jgi:FAD/FMN-containing dehydrogenase
MHGMDPIDPVARTVRVQPGIVLDRLRDEAEKFNLTFAPDPATHSRCTLGGMIGNNSCGIHALMGGKTVDNIVSLDLLLYDGTRLTVGPTSVEELAAKIAGGGRIGEIYAGLKDLRDCYAPLIRERFPDIPRRVSGFNLDELLPGGSFNVARALVGSEGTCAIILGATLRLVESPPFRTLLGIGFSDIFVAADHVPHLLEHPLIGLEGIDNYLLEALRRKQKSLDDITLLPDGKGFLLAELGGNTQAGADAKAEALAASLASLPIPPDCRIYTPAQAVRVWHIRESGLGATDRTCGRWTR